MVDNPSATEAEFVGMDIDIDIAVRLFNILSIPCGLIGLEDVKDDDDDEHGVPCGGGEGDRPPEEAFEKPWLSIAVFMSVMLWRAARGPVGLLARFPRLKFLPPLA